MTVVVVAKETFAHRAGFLRDLITMGGSSIRSIPRELDSVIPALVVPVFFYVVNVGALQVVAESGPVGDFKAFQLPVAIIFAVTGVSRAGILVTDIQSGYLDRLLLTPMRRSTLLLGMMVADFVLMLALCIPVVILGFAVGVRFETGLLGVLMFFLLGALWGLAFTGFPYAIALKTGSPTAVNSAFILFFPFAFLTTTLLPLESLTGWMAAIARVNPVTYLLEGMRSLITEGWVAEDLLAAFASVFVVGLFTFALAIKTMTGRLARG
ncbi:MAG: ABC transporter permease [Acidimicrobiales bacterium]